MKTKRRGGTRRTTVGAIDAEALAFTVGRDIELDAPLAIVDCVGTAAHVTMLSRMRGAPRVLSEPQRRRVIAALNRIVSAAREGRFRIRPEDQDVHLAVERMLTAELGDLGRRVHTGRSRNDQAAVDLRLFGKEQLLAAMAETLALAGALAAFAWRHRRVPMAGRTHMQPAMPSSVGLWAAGHAESLLDDVALLIAAYDLNDQSPLGSAAGFGVPLPIRPEVTAALLGFSRAVSNAAYAASSRGKLESIILGALAQAMLTLSRLAQDLMLYTMPEFGYFRLPAAFCTGSSIMPQKRNPDVLELVRARAAAVAGWAHTAVETVRGLPSGYNRDLQEIKGPFMDGMRTTRASLRIMARMLRETEIDIAKLRAGFRPEVFATDRALELVAGGMPFRDAYHHVKAHLDELSGMDPVKAALRKTHLGAPGGLDFAGLRQRLAAGLDLIGRERREHARAIGKLMGRAYEPAV